MALKWYCCKNCGNTTKREGSPGQNGCSASSAHTWFLLGEVGDTNYSCKNCGLVVKTKNVPARSGCKNSSSHDWLKQ